MKVDAIISNTTILLFHCYTITIFALRLKKVNINCLQPGRNLRLFYSGENEHCLLTSNNPVLFNFQNLFYDTNSIEAKICFAVRLFPTFVCDFHLRPAEVHTEWIHQRRLQRGGAHRGHRIYC